MKFLSVLILAFSSFAIAKKTVCTATINSKEEREVFRSKLNPQDFNFVELTDYSSDKLNKSNDWFEKACESGIKCDVLIVSGHFGGSFFGDTDYSLELGTLEKNSCQKRCAGILENPKEVFLFGCNTLATKDLDHRTPQQYFAALVEHGIDAAEAERIVSARYSPIGSSYSDRMRRIFEGVPLIYGFSSVGPSGKNVKSSLTKYLNEIGDYNKHLQSIEDGKTENQTFLKNMTAYTTALASGMKTNEPVLAEVKENSCKLSDDNVSLEDRLEHAGNILQSSPYIYFPTVADFVSQNFSNQSIQGNNTDIANKLVRITARTELKEQVMKIANAGGFGPTLQMDLLNFSRTVLWLSSTEYEMKVRELFNDLLRKPTIQNADVFCSLMEEQEDSSSDEVKLKLEDLPTGMDFSNIYSLLMLGCSSTEDSRITGIVLDSIKKLNLSTISNLIYAQLLYKLSELPGYEDEITEFALNLPARRGPYEKEIKVVTKNLILKKVKGPRQTELYKQYQADYKNDLDSLEQVEYSLSENSYLMPETETFLIQSNYKRCLGRQTECYNIHISMNPVVYSWMAKYIDFNKNATYTEGLISVLSNNVQMHETPIRIPSEFASHLLEYALNGPPAKYQDGGIHIIDQVLNVLQFADFDTSTLRVIRAHFAKRVQENDSRSLYEIQKLRWLIHKNRDKIGDLTESELKGSRMRNVCKKLGKYTINCEFEITQD